MCMADGTFKSRLFGGFDRRDVASYIEKLAAERNSYIVKCRDLEQKREEYASEIDNLKADYEKKLSDQKSEFEAENEKLKKEYEEKISELEAEVALANIRAEEKRTKEKEEVKKLLQSVSERFESAGSDAQLTCAHMTEELESVRNTVEKLPEILISSKERIEEIIEKID